MKTHKQPCIRPGQHRPYVKGTQAQIDERRGFVARMMDEGATKTEIHRAVRERFNVEWRQCDRYIAWLARGRAEHRQIMRRENVHVLIKRYQQMLSQEQGVFPSEHLCHVV